MATYQYIVEGTAARGQTWITEGAGDTARDGTFLAVVEAALRESFEQLTHGKAVYGSPGVGCTGPYTITRLVVERLPTEY